MTLDERCEQPFSPHGLLTVSPFLLMRIPEVNHTSQYKMAPKCLVFEWENHQYFWIFSILIFHTNLSFCLKGNANQQYINSELPDVQAGFRKGKRTRDQIANIWWIIEKAREFQKNIISVLLTTPKPLTVFSSVQPLSRVRLFATPWIARPPCPSPTPGVDSNSCPSSQWCHPAISSSVVPFSSCPQSLPASGSFPVS